MLSKILSKSDCASCRFCCSFRRQSLWETPLFTETEKNALESKYPAARFKHTGKTSWTINLDDCYKTSDSEEEAPCPFLDPHKGCILSAGEKPFDCSIWPLRVIKRGTTSVIALTPTCQAINKVPIEKVVSLAREIRSTILKKAAENPDIIKDDRSDFIVLTE